MPTDDFLGLAQTRRGSNWPATSYRRPDDARDLLYRLSFATDAQDRFIMSPSGGFGSLQNVVKP